MNRPFILLLPIILLLTSCFKEDDKVEPHDPGDVETAVVELTNNYKYQAYFDLGTGEVVASNMKKIWDLGFECSEDGWHIILNTSSFMYASRTGTTDFEIPQDTVGKQWKYDKSDGDLDSTAIGSWFEYSLPDSARVYTNEVYLLNRGYDELGNELGFRKIVFTELDGDTYSFHYSDLNGSNEGFYSVTKEPSVSFIYFSFNDGGQVFSLEPPIPEWDLLFTQYTTLLYTNEGEPYPYLVTGALNNRVGVAVAQDTLYDFSAIDRVAAESLAFSTAMDEIGYDWKDVTGDVTSGNITYNVIPGINYVVRDPEGFLYKLRFISFYDKGEKGFPTFEFQRL